MSAVETQLESATDRGLHRYTIYGAVLAGAGLPIYIHAPKFFNESYGISLTAIAGVLVLLRMFDFIQDPLLGWVADRLGRARGVVAATITVILGASMVALFAVPAPIEPLWWFVLCLAVLFTSFSFLWILFYARGIAKGETLGANGPLRLAAWREFGTLLGICLASIVPSLLMMSGLADPLVAFSIGFFAAAVVAAIVMAPEWAGRLDVSETGTWQLLRDKILRQLLVVGLFNAAPVAVSASLFLFYVEYRLGDAAAAGPLLLVFFVAAAATAPFWSRMAESRGTKETLILGMVLAIVSFSFAIFLGDGDVWIFALICLASGAALGADMTLLPALFSRRVDQVKGAGGQAFGLWNFCSKLTLAVAAATVLPLLDAAGFTNEGNNPPEVLMTLTVLYAVVPSGLKVIALCVLYWTPIEER
ncbi:MAG: MFS transporter [Pseudomonadota bacterium]